MLYNVYKATMMHIMHNIVKLLDKVVLQERGVR